MSSSEVVELGERLEDLSGEELIKQFRLLLIENEEGKRKARENEEVSFFRELAHCTEFTPSNRARKKPSWRATEKITKDVPPTDVCPILAEPPRPDFEDEVRRRWEAFLAHPVHRSRPSSMKERDAHHPVLDVILQSSLGPETPLRLLYENDEEEAEPDFTLTDRRDALPSARESLLFVEVKKDGDLYHALDQARLYANRRVAALMNEVRGVWGNLDFDLRQIQCFAVGTDGRQLGFVRVESGAGGPENPFGGRTPCPAWFSTALDLLPTYNFATRSFRGTVPRVVPEGFRQLVHFFQHADRLERFRELLPKRTTVTRVSGFHPRLSTSASTAGGSAGRKSGDGIAPEGASGRGCGRKRGKRGGVQRGRAGARAVGDGEGGSIRRTTEAGAASSADAAGGGGAARGGGRGRGRRGRGAGQRGAVHVDISVDADAPVRVDAPVGTDAAEGGGAAGAEAGKGSGDEKDTEATQIVLEIDAELGTGGCGTVYKCTLDDGVGGVDVVVKVVRAHTDDAIELLKNEAATLQLLQLGEGCAHIPRLRFQGLWKARSPRLRDWPVLVQQPLGESVRAWVGRFLAERATDDKNPLLLRKEAADRVVSGVLKALDHAHSRRILHCDIRPDNVIVSRNEALLIDWGIARSFDAKGYDAGVAAYAADGIVSETTSDKKRVGYDLTSVAYLWISIAFSVDCHAPWIRASDWTVFDVRRDWMRNHMRDPDIARFQYSISKWVTGDLVPWPRARG